MIPKTSPELIDRQLQLEELSLDMGTARYNKDRPSPWRTDVGRPLEEADTKPGKELVRRAVEPLAEAIREGNRRWEEKKGSRGRPAAYAKYLAAVEPEPVAFITARAVITAASKQEKLTKTAISIATTIEDHIRYEEMAQSDPGLYRHVLNRLRKTSHAGHRRGVLNHALKLTEVAGLGWSPSDKLHVGLRLIDLFVQATGLVEVITRRLGQKTIDRLFFAPDTLAWLERGHGICAVLSPIHLPMVHPPQPWTNPVDGGYLGRDNLRVPLVKVFHKDSLDEYFSLDMPQVYGAVNAIQEVPWRISQGLLSIAQEAWERDLEIAALPRREDQLVPERLAHIPHGVPLKDLPEDQQREVQSWCSRARQVHEANALSHAKRFCVMQQLWTADKFKDEPAIWFPHALDFRGRVYPVPTALNPQSDDLGKALLEFARGQALGEDGAFWLAVHIANSYGFDKAPLADRVRWVQEHEAQVLDSAMRPLDGDLWWTEGDSPWQLLAACLEWAGYVASGRSPEFISHLPVSIDGTCSGLQHFSALLRDPIGAVAVNLEPAAPGQPKADIYQIVADKVLANCQVDSALVTRKTVKQPAMTYAYSAGMGTMAHQMESALAKQGLPPGPACREAAKLLAQPVHAAIEDTVQAAAGAMGWLREVARLFAKENLPMHWQAPTGMLVVQAPKKSRLQWVEANFAGVRKKLAIRKEQEKVDGLKNANAISPNYIHSMDAAHLMWTVLGCTSDGLVDLAVVHDSFGAHAGSVSLLREHTRHAFVALYEGNRLQELADHLQQQLPAGVKLPRLPRIGTFDLERVLLSEFFFC